MHCSVWSCKSVFGGGYSKGRRLSFYSFPKCVKRRAEWEHRCGRADPINWKMARICSKHFKQDDMDPSCVLKRKLGITCRMRLKSDAIPSVNLPMRPGGDVDSERDMRQSRRSLKKTAAGLLLTDGFDASDAYHQTCLRFKEYLQRQQRANWDAVDPDDLEKERWQSGNMQRDEHEGKSDHDQLIERLLEDYLEKEQEADENNTGRKLNTIELPQLETGIRKPGAGAAPSRPQDSVARAVAEADIVAEQDAADAAADLSDDDRPSPGGDDGAAPAGGDGDEDWVDWSPAGAKIGLNTASAARSSKPAKVISLKTFAPARLALLRPTSREDVMLQRTKEIMRLKLKVRRLEAKCLRGLGGPTVPRPGEDASVDDGPAVGEEKTAEELKAAGGGEKQGNGEEGPLAGPSRALGEEPLVILRNDRNWKMPSILRQLRANQLSDGMATFMPSNLQEAKAVNHQLKVQFLNLQAVMLSWVTKNQRLRTKNMKRAEEGKEDVILRGPRVRELLRLEAAVKAVFTEAQIRAIISNHADSSSGDATEKRRKHPWGEEDVRRMLELRAISSDKVVEHVREKMKIPLPSLKTARLRCKKSQRISEAYKEMVQTNEKTEKLCSMCERQVNSIDEVIDATEDQLPELGEESHFGRQFVQHVPQHGQDTAGVRPKKRRRTATAATSAAKKEKRRQAPAALDWSNTSDSDAELSDPGTWGRISSSRVSWQPEMIGGGAPLDEPPPPPLSLAPDPFGYGRTQRSWR